MMLHMRVKVTLSRYNSVAGLQAGMDVRHVSALLLLVTNLFR
jgi:hypothetical protein